MVCDAVLSEVGDHGCLAEACVLALYVLKFLQITEIV